MTSPAYPGTTYVYLSIDSANDLSTSTLNVGSTLASLTTTATYISQPPIRLTALEPLPKTGLTRYWWKILAGIGQTLALTAGENLFYGQLVDNPETLPQRWQVQLQGFPS